VHLKSGLAGVPEKPGSDQRLHQPVDPLPRPADIDLFRHKLQQSRRDISLVQAD
jgi:hypothetical protein